MLRIFISSTMKDLANERSQVREKLIRYNFTPVNAEDLPSSTSPSWQTLEAEIRSCNLFVLLLGERYGWVPTEGPHANEGKSITHLEYEVAKQFGIPILPFLKEFSYDDTDRASDDAKRRDEFRQAIRDYATGFFTARYFKLASDLAESVGESVIKMLSDTFAKAQVAVRAEEVSQYAGRMARVVPRAPAAAPISIPPDLVEAVVSRQAVLFAGAGFSLSAGLPSASAFAERLTQVIRETAPDYSANMVGSALAGIATDLQTIGGRGLLNEAIVDLLQLPQ